MSLMSLISSEYCVERAKHRNTHGLQGCSNKEICGEYGFYLKTYGRDGLCDVCLHQKYPNDLSICAMCNLATNNHQLPTTCLCFPCEMWLHKLFDIENDKILRSKYSWRECHDLQGALTMLTESLVKPKMATTESLAPANGKSKGFYTPDLKNRVYFDKLDTSRMEINGITWENRDTIALRVLTEHGFVFSEYHIRHKLV